MSFGFGHGFGLSTGGGNPLARYAITQGGIVYLPLLVDDASLGLDVAFMRNLELRDYAIVQGGVAFSPLMVDDADNEVTIK